MPYNRNHLFALQMSFLSDNASTNTESETIYGEAIDK